MTLTLAQFIRETAVKATDWLLFIMITPIIVIVFLIISKGKGKDDDE